MSRPTNPDRLTVIDDALAAGNAQQTKNSRKASKVRTKSAAPNYSPVSNAIAEIGADVKQGQVIGGGAGMSLSASSHATVASHLLMGQAAENSTVERHSHADANAHPSRDKARGTRKLRSARPNRASTYRKPAMKAFMPEDRPAETSFQIGFAYDDHTVSHPVTILVSEIDASWIALQIVTTVGDREGVVAAWIRVNRVSNAEGHFVGHTLSANTEEWASIQPRDVDELLSLAEPFEGGEAVEAGWVAAYLLRADCIPKFLAARLGQPTLH